MVLVDFQGRGNVVIFVVGHKMIVVAIMTIGVDSMEMVVLEDGDRTIGGQQEEVVVAKVRRKVEESEAIRIRISVAEIRTLSKTIRDIEDNNDV